MGLLTDFVRNFFGGSPSPPKRVPPKLRRETHSAPKAVRDWEWNGLRVQAPTKSEARAKFKLAYQIKRLPSGAIVRKVTE